jgi:hypothetical protein
MKFEEDLPHCVRNVKKGMYSCSNFVAISTQTWWPYKLCSYILYLIVIGSGLQELDKGNFAF